MHTKLQLKSQGGHSVVFHREIGSQNQPTLISPDHQVVTELFIGLPTTFQMIILIIYNLSKSFLLMQKPYMHTYYYALFIKVCMGCNNETVHTCLFHLVPFCLHYISVFSVSSSALGIYFISLCLQMQQKKNSCVVI